MRFSSQKRWQRRRCTQSVTIALAGSLSIAVAPCFAQSSAIVACWGNDDNSQCTPQSSLGRCSQVAAGKYHSVAIKEDGTVACWGSNAFQQWVPHLPGALLTAVAAGGFHTLGVDQDGVVRAWGRNQQGQCTVPTNLGSCVKVAAGALHSMALRTTGEIVAWGDDEFGQSSVPDSPQLSTAIAAGGYHSVALTATGRVVCFGRNESAVTGSQRAAAFLRDARDGVDSVDLLFCGDSNTGFAQTSTGLSGWTDGIASALIARGFTQYATPLAPVQPPGTSFGIGSAVIAMPIGSGSTSGETEAFNVSGIANAPAELVQQLTSGAEPFSLGLHSNGLPFDFCWIPLQAHPFANESSGIILSPTSPLGVQSELIYRLLRGAIPSSGQPGSYAQGWRDLNGANLVMPVVRSVEGQSYGWTADELVLPADETRALARIHATCGGAGFGQAFGVTGNCALGLHSVYKQSRGFATQTLEYRGGATMTQIANDVARMPLESRMTWLGELVARQTAAGGSGRLIVFIQGGINCDANLPQSWGDAVTVTRTALEEAWTALGRNPESITFIGMVSHPASAVDSALAPIRNYANDLPDTIANLTIVDLSRLTSSGELLSRGWYSFGSHSHLSDAGYSSLSTRIIGSLLDEYFPCSTPADCQAVGSCVRIAAGEFHTVALKSDGTVRCWGSPHGGACEVPVTLEKCIEIGAGDAHTVAIERGGVAAAWGLNDHLQSSVPFSLGFVSGIAGGGSHTVVIGEAPTDCRGDWNSDGMRDGLDMTAILAGWGSPSGDCNDDGITDGIDLAVLLAGWGPCPD